MGYLPTLILSGFCILFCNVFCKTTGNGSSNLNEANSSCVPWTIDPNTNRLRCGEVMTLPNGTIFHKPYEPIGENERCVWTIPLSTDSGSGKTIQFHILHLGFPSTNDSSATMTITVRPQLLFTALYGEVPLLKNVIPDGTGAKFTMEAQTVVITFSSGDLSSAENYTGFIINYIGEFEPLVDPQNVSHIQMPPAKMNFFVSRSYYELATFVFPPGDNYYPGNAYPVIFTESENNGNVGYIYVYRFNASSVERPWEMIQSSGFSPASYTRWIPGYDDILLLAFQARYSQTAMGFQLFNARCEPEEEN